MIMNKLVGSRPGARSFPVTVMHSPNLEIVLRRHNYGEMLIHKLLVLFLIFVKAFFGAIGNKT